MNPVPAHPRASVIVPAHQEEQTIARCLDALLPPGPTCDYEVVVVANGCTDATAEVARGYPVSVLDLAEGNKAAALDAGDRACSTFPRVYVDADVVLDAASLEALLQALDTHRPLLATPRARYETPGASLAVRLYWRTWQRLQQARGDLLGCGVYAVNEAGRTRWDRFPTGMADDYHVHTVFEPAERVQVAQARSVVRPPRTLSSLLAVRTRVYAGMLEHHAERAPLRRPPRRLGPLVRDPVALLGLPVYVALTVVAKRRAARRTKSSGSGGAAHWARDDSGRAA